MVSEVLLFLEYYKVVLGGALILVVTASEFIFFLSPSTVANSQMWPHGEGLVVTKGVDSRIKHKEDFSQRIEIPLGHTFLSVKQKSLIK